MEYETIAHNFAPVYDQNSRVLILGTFPSVKSRAIHFYYGHPQNRFWKLLALLTDSPVPQSVNEKKAFLLQNRIALWDVIAQCEIVGSSDSSIRNVIPNDLTTILQTVPGIQIFANGAKAWELYQKHMLPSTGRSCIKLPSTSPANAAWNLERLKEGWTPVKEALFC